MGDVYEISAEEIKRYREPRLMTKFDTSESVAAPLRERHLNVLPLSRHSYGVGRFELYEKFPNVANVRPSPLSLPDYETLRVDNLTSESSAINALMVSHALEEFLGEEDCGFVETFNGRMGTDAFDFNVKMYGTPQPALVHVDRAQLEIDGGFESERSVTIMEAKNVRNNDFNVRQLYFPFRKYFDVVHKPIRLVFSQYTNLTYYLYEYEFEDWDFYSSVHLLDVRAYTFEDRQISMSDLRHVWESVKTIIDDNQETAPFPFIQADRFDRVISLAERLSSAPGNVMTTDEVTVFMGTVERQASYYSAAGEYLGLFDHPERGLVELTPVAKKLLELGYRNRQLAYAELILEHEVFHKSFETVLSTGTLPEREDVVRLMLELNVCNPGATVTRRASTVLGWLRWILSLADEEL